MLIDLYVPSWVKKHNHPIENIHELPEDFIQQIRENLKDKKPDQPVISIGIIAYNEEEKILSCISSLAAQKSKYPIEIIISNNNSTDHTQELLDMVGVISVFQPKQGAGFARQAIMDVAKGKYLLNGDADTLYPQTWANEMVRHLEMKGISGVYSMDSYMPDEKRGRFMLLLFEVSRDLSQYLKGFKRPELGVGGSSFGFRLNEGKEIGWQTNIKRGEDGAMAFALKKFGKLKLVNTRKARVWATTRSLENKGTLFAIFIQRIAKELSRYYEYFTSEKKGYADRDENLIK
ncbi:MAG: glycosyltransferase family 2 protein [Bacteroidia bacterium]|nr:glycosyltransferase family 2 protein [Bacteroidia bacterium]